MKSIYFIPVILLLWYNKSWSQCPATVTISGSYSTVYTGSNSWIASSGTTTIPTGTNVTLDANPANNGYVLMDIGFETAPNSTFLATVETPCSLLGTNQNLLSNILSIYPNPANNFININANIDIINIKVFDINGRLISDEIHNSDSVVLNTEKFSNGLYLMKIKTENGISIQKFMKE